MKEDDKNNTLFIRGGNKQAACASSLIRQISLHSCKHRMKHFSVAPETGMDAVEREGIKKTDALIR